jgi:hypothetical protein
MRIVSPVDQFAVAGQLLDAGADELYGGVSTAAWGLCVIPYLSRFCLGGLKLIILGAPAVQKVINIISVRKFSQLAADFDDVNTCRDRRELAPRTGSAIGCYDSESYVGE